MSMSMLVENEEQCHPQMISDGNAMFYLTVIP